MAFCPTGLVGRLFLKTPAPHQPFEGFVPDLMMRNGDEISLREFGVDGIVRHAAGHTPGSVSVELATHEALVGDLIASGILIGGIAFTGRAIRPPFEDDAERVSLELEGLVDRGATRFYMGHGGPLSVAEVMQHARSRPKTRRHPCAVSKCSHA